MVTMLSVEPGLQSLSVDVFVRQLHVGLHVEEFAKLFGYRHIEVDEILPLALEERTYVVFVIHKERTLAVSRHYGVPVLVAPLAVVADANVAHRTLRSLVTLNRHGERLHSVGGSNETAVAIGLLAEVVVLLYNHAPVTMELLHPLNGREVGGGKKGTKTLPTPRKPHPQPLPRREGSGMLFLVRKLWFSY